MVELINFYNFNQKIVETFEGENLSLLLRTEARKKGEENEGKEEEKRRKKGKERRKKKESFKVLKRKHPPLEQVEQKIKVK